MLPTPAPVATERITVALAERLGRAEPSRAESSRAQFTSPTGVLFVPTNNLFSSGWPSRRCRRQSDFMNIIENIKLARFISRRRSYSNLLATKLLLLWIAANWKDSKDNNSSRHSAKFAPRQLGQLAVGGGDWSWWKLKPVIIIITCVFNSCKH